MKKTKDSVLLDAFAEGFGIVIKRNPDAGPRIKLKLARQVLGLSQRDFAEMFGLSYSSVRNWELEAGSTPSGAAKTLIDILAEDPVVVKQLALRANQRSIEVECENV